jgi:hypothetical protein
MKGQEQKKECIENSHALGLLAWMELFSFSMYPANSSNHQSLENSSTTENDERIIVEPLVR